VGLERIGADAHHDHFGPEQRIVLLGEGPHLGGAAVGEIAWVEREHHGLAAVECEVVRLVGRPDPFLASPREPERGGPAPDVRP
jgi:hypothetical protein